MLTPLRKLGIWKLLPAQKTDRVATCLMQIDFRWKLNLPGEFLGKERATATPVE